MPTTGPGARLFDGYDDADLERHPGFVLGRLLEEGDSRDLRRLARRVPETEWKSWLEHEGGRGLSDRSRVFWSLVLGCELAEVSEASGLRRAVWLL
jgi:hypothetical protein